MLKRMRILLIALSWVFCTSITNITLSDSAHAAGTEVKKPGAKKNPKTEKKTGAKKPKATKEKTKKPKKTNKPKKKVKKEAPKEDDTPAEEPSYEISSPVKKVIGLSHSNQNPLEEMNVDSLTSE